MPRRKQSRGTCAFCGHETTKGSIEQAPRELPTAAGAAHQH